MESEVIPSVPENLPTKRANERRQSLPRAFVGLEVDCQVIPSAIGNIASQSAREKDQPFEQLKNDDISSDTYYYQRGAILILRCVTSLRTLGLRLRRGVALSLSHDVCVG